MAVFVGSANLVVSGRTGLPRKIGRLFPRESTDVWSGVVSLAGPGGLDDVYRLLRATLVALADKVYCRVLMPRRLSVDMSKSLGDISSGRATRNWGVFGYDAALRLWLRGIVMVGWGRSLSAI